MTARPRPFTVIGGFLGVGKTTLVNRILARACGVRYAVMVNDFGAINVDAGLIAAHDGRTMALTNGCICCSLSDGFVTTMLRLMEEPESFDHVIVEASGVALPDRIMDFARLDPALSPDAVIVLVDAETLAARLEDRHVGEVVAAQIECADILLVTKLDLAGADTLDAVKAMLRQRSPQSAVIADDLIDTQIDALLGTGAAARSGSDRRHVHTAFHTLTLRASLPISCEEFERFAAALPASVIRGKGHVAFSVSRNGVRWQRVGSRMETTVLETSIEVSEIVLIGTEPLTDLRDIPSGMSTFT